MSAPLVDAHVHLFPRRLAEAIRGAFLAAGDLPFAYPIDNDATLTELAAEGVTEVWALPYARRPGTAVAMNEAFADTAAAAADAAHGVRVVNGCTLHPDDEDPVAIVRDAVERLGAGVLKLHSSVGSFDADHPRLDAVWRYVSEVRLPVTVHAGHGFNGKTDADELEPVVRVARAHPEARIVIAHCGHEAVHAALDAIAAHPNLYADLTPVMREPVALPADRAKEAWPRLLLGSDAPNVAVRAAQVRDQVLALGLGDEATGAILGANARRLQDEIVR